MPLQTVHDVLVNDAAVNGLVGDKVHPQVAPLGESYPYVVLKVPTTEPSNALDGYAGLSRNEVLVLAYALEYLAAVALANACRSALQNAGHLCLSRIADDTEFQPDAAGFIVGFVHQVWTA